MASIGIGSPPAGHPPVVHFRAFNELRFLAAFGVIIHHIEVNKYRLGYESLVGHPLFDRFITHLGQFAVSCFFALSGFLMTYLLLEEHRVAGAINVKAFYIRRVLRIWPLYFLTVAIGFVLMPGLAHLTQLPSIYQKRIDALEMHWGGALLLFVFMLPNLALRFYPPVVGASHAWSIGVEEQFYALWPWFMRWFRRRLVAALVGLVAAKFALQALAYGISITTTDSSIRNAAGLAHVFLSRLWIENMAFGGLGAWAVVAGVAPRLVSWPIQFASTAAILLVTFASTGSKLIDHLIEPLAFTILMINLSLNPRPLFRVDSAWMNRLGQISYGLYMFHPAVIVWTFTVLPPTAANHTGLLSAAAYAIVLPVTWLLSHLSYRYLESRFLARKPRYSVVMSAPESHTEGTRL